MATYEIVGKIHWVGETEPKSNNFRIRRFVLYDESAPQYPQYVKIQLKQENCALVDGLKVGDLVKVLFALEGRQFTNSRTGGTDFFTTVTAFRVVLLSRSRDGDRDFSPPTVPLETSYGEEPF